MLTIQKPSVNLLSNQRLSKPVQQRFTQSADTIQFGNKTSGSSDKKMAAAALLGLLALPTMAWGVASAKKVDSGNACVPISRLHGTEQEVKGEGTHFIPSFWKRLSCYDMSQQQVVEVMQNQSRDNNQVGAEVSIFWRLDPEIDSLYNVQKNIVASGNIVDLPEDVHGQIDLKNNQIVFDKIVRPLLQARVGDQISQFKAEDVNDNRAVIRQRVLNGYTNDQEEHIVGLKEELAQYGVIVDKVEVRRAIMPDELQHAITDRAASLIDRETAKNEAAATEERARGDANAQIARAEGEAKSIELEGEAVRNNPEALRLRELEALENADLIVTDGDLQVLTTPPGQSVNTNNASGG